MPLIYSICDSRNFSRISDHTDKWRTVSESFYNIRSASLSKGTDHSLGLFRVRSPLLPESMFLSLPPAT